MTLRLLSVLLCGLCVGAAGDANGTVARRNIYTPNTISFAESATPAIPAYQQFKSSAWTAKASASTAASAVQWQILRNDPRQDSLVMMTSSTDLGVRLQTWNGVSWSGASLLTPDCGTIV